MLVYNIVTGIIFLVSLGIFVFISVDWKKILDDFHNRKKEMTYKKHRQKR